jgi:hypothetical protein
VQLYVKGEKKERNETLAYENTAAKRINREIRAITPI